MPIYAVKSSGSANLVKAVRTLMGIDPSAAGGLVSLGTAETLHIYTLDFTLGHFTL